MSLQGKTVDLTTPGTVLALRAISYIFATYHSRPAQFPFLPAMNSAIIIAPVPTSNLFLCIDLQFDDPALT